MHAPSFMWHAPLIARLLSVASFTAVNSMLSGEGIPFDRLAAKHRLVGIGEERRPPREVAHGRRREDLAGRLGTKL